MKNKVGISQIWNIFDKKKILIYHCFSIIGQPISKGLGEIVQFISKYY